MLYIDGSYGEGGGQVLRTCLSLAAITGQAVRMEHIRAGRKHPGLAIQHLTAVRAAAQLCQAEVQGDRLGSTTLDFVPHSPPQAGTYTFDVNETTGAGSAGSISLILQTILLPLARAEGPSHVVLRGGTHVPWSPPITYLEQVYLPILQRMGLPAEVSLRAWGWYPQGQGEAELHVAGPASPWQGLQCLKRGPLQQVQGLAVVTELPSHIPQRMASQAMKVLQQADLKAQVRPLRAKGIAPGAGIFLTAEYEQSWAGFSALGQVGLPAERVAEMACEALLHFHATQAPIDPLLADQLLLPAALASEVSQYRTTEMSLHLTSNAWVIEQFGVAKVAIDPDHQIVTVTPQGKNGS